MSLEDLMLKMKARGNWGHAGRPGKRGGSLPKGGGGNGDNMPEIGFALNVRKLKNALPSNRRPSVSEFGTLKQETSGSRGIGPFSGPAGYSVKANKVGKVVAEYLVGNSSATERNRNLASKIVNGEKVKEDDFYNVLTEARDLLHS